MDDKEERIRRRAHAIWESEGRPFGEEERHWEQARREIEEGPPSDAPGSGEDEDTGTIVAPATAPHGKAHRGADES
ncbi:hypothetical protein BC374_20245 [Ensifer sp. LC13]|uniref:DUF2934 domain-containing protein n=1 Tax=Ensifer sp. LC499 TaxID=1120654 RepID=UPI00081319F3|nr:hypothetical protein BBX50_23380 [Ensifer sp. LC11]OCP09083.1 hypothetical protein BC374_20245 [Ensifer sp. LC13]OCP09866.1 hypothetical protein BC362_09020 [Ensifer sp. LC14]OCP31581.1 hypothetical protein BC364_23230 [Ensifer sp. LC499]